MDRLELNHGPIYANQTQQKREERSILSHPLAQLTLVVGLGALAYACYRTFEGKPPLEATPFPSSSSKTAALAAQNPLFGCESADPVPVYPPYPPFDVAELQADDTSVGLVPYTGKNFLAPYRDGRKVYSTFYNEDGSDNPVTSLVNSADPETNLVCASSKNGDGAIGYINSQKVTLDVLSSTDGVTYSFDTFCGTGTNVYDLTEGKNGDQWLLTYKCSADLHLEKFSIEAQPLNSFVPTSSSFQSAGSVSLSGETVFYYDDGSSTIHLDWLDEDLHAIRSPTTIPGVNPKGVEVGEGNVFLTYKTSSSFLATRVIASNSTPQPELVLTETAVNAFKLARSSEGEVGLFYTLSDGSYVQKFDATGACLGPPTSVLANDASGVGFTDDNLLVLLDKTEDALRSQSLYPEHPPQIVNPVANQYAEVLVPYNYTIPDNVAVNPDPGQTLTYAVDLKNGSNLSSTWLTFNPSNNALYGTPPSGTQNTSLPLALNISDGYASNSTPFNVTVTSSSPTAPPVSPDKPKKDWEILYWIAFGVFGASATGYAWKKREKIQRSVTCCLAVCTAEICSKMFREQSALEVTLSRASAHQIQGGRTVSYGSNASSVCSEYSGGMYEVSLRSGDSEIE